MRAHCASKGGCIRTRLTNPPPLPGYQSSARHALTLPPPPTAAPITKRAATHALTPPPKPLPVYRPLVSERAVLERADGSAKWVQDGTAVLAAVHGPTQAGQRKEDAERAVIQVLFKPRNGIAGGFLTQGFDRWLAAVLVRTRTCRPKQASAEKAVIQVLFQPFNGTAGGIVIPGAGHCIDLPSAVGKQTEDAEKALFKSWDPSLCRPGGGGCWQTGEALQAAGLTQGAKMLPRLFYNGVQPQIMPISPTGTAFLALIAGSQEHEYEVMLQSLLEQVILTSHHPRTAILVVVQVCSQFAGRGWGCAAVGG
jgi:hypothetical protein